MLGQQIFLDHRSSRTIDQKLRCPTMPPVAAAPPLSFLSLPKNGHFFLLQHNGSPGRSQNDQAYLEVLAQAVEDRGCLDPPCCLEREQIIYLENWARRQKLRKRPKLLTRIGSAQKKVFFLRTQTEGIFAFIKRVATSIALVCKVSLDCQWVL